MDVVYLHELEMEYDDYPRVWEFDDYLPFLCKHHSTLQEVHKESYEECPEKKVFTNRVVPRLPVPENLQRFLSSRKLEYTERIEWNLQKNHHIFEALLHHVSFLQIGGYFTLHKLGERRLQREARFAIEAKVPLVGKLVEKYLSEQLDQSYREEAALRSRFAQEHFYTQTSGTQA